MKGKKMFLSIASISPLLMSAASGVTVFSNIMNKQLPEGVVERVICDSSETFNAKTNSSNNNIAFNATVDYEVFKMGHNKLYTSWDNNYSIIFRVRVDLCSQVEYKDGWWIFASTQKSDTYLSYISADVRVDTLPTDYKPIATMMPSSEQVVSCDKSSQDDVTAGAGDYATSNGGFYIYMLNYYKIEDGYIPDDGDMPNYFSTENYGLTEKESHINYKANYDLINGVSFDNRSVFLYGSLSFKGNTDPKNIRLNIEVGYGLTPTYKPIEVPKDEKSSAEKAIRKAKLKPKRTTYKYSNKSNIEIKFN